MAQSFPETAHLKTDMNKYGENYDRIFKKAQGQNPDSLVIEVSLPCEGESTQASEEVFSLDDLCSLDKLE